MKIILFFIIGSIITSCSQVLQTVDLEINTDDSLAQETFKVVEKTLTFNEARKQKNAPYLRTVLRNGRGANAQPISEKLALKSEVPKNKTPIGYKIGFGDTITFSRLIENNRLSSKIGDEWPIQKIASNYKLGIGDTVALILMKDDSALSRMNPINRSNSNGDSGNQNLIISPQQNDVTITTTGRIGSDGSVLLLEVGRLEANGKSLNELRSEVRNNLIRNGVSPRFQLEITDFRSQKAYLTVSSTQGTASQIINLNDQRTTLLDILTSSQISYQPGVITVVKLRRGNDILSMRLRDIFTTGSPQIHILDRDHIFVEENLAELVESVSKVDQSGNIVFEGVGKIKAVGRSVSELRAEIEGLMQQVPGSQNAFQVQITNFSSQTALLSIPGKPGVTIPITDNPTSLTEVLTQNGLSIDVGSITRINLYRNGKTYVFTLDVLLEPNNHNVYLQPKDRITAYNLPYKPSKVFILGGVTPQIFKITPSNRETLADALFTGNGVLSTASAKRSEVYLLRGNNPVVAYHLDAQSPTRLIVADAMELRPNDILYVAEQPIISFNRTLETIIPLRFLLRDIQDNDIP